MLGGLDIGEFNIIMAVVIVVVVVVVMVDDDVSKGLTNRMI